MRLVQPRPQSYYYFVVHPSPIPGQSRSSSACFASFVIGLEQFVGSVRG